MKFAFRTALALASRLDDPEYRKRVEVRFRGDRNVLRLLETMRSVTRRANLPAPEVFESDKFPEPEAVARWFDRPDETDAISKRYEDACLESDILLAEAVCCAEILDVSLQQPIRAPRYCRKRLYALDTNSQRPIGDSPRADEEKGWLDRFDVQGEGPSRSRGDEERGRPLDREKRKDRDYRDYRGKTTWNETIGDAGANIGRTDENGEETRFERLARSADEEEARNETDEAPQTNSTGSFRPMDDKKSPKKSVWFEKLLLAIFLVGLVAWLLPIAKSRLTPTESRPGPISDLSTITPGQPTSETTPLETVPSATDSTKTVQKTIVPPQWERLSLRYSTNTPSKEIGRQPTLVIPTRNNNVFQK